MAALDRSMRLGCTDRALERPWWLRSPPGSGLDVLCTANSVTSAWDRSPAHAGDLPIAGKSRSSTEGGRRPPAPPRHRVTFHLPSTSSAQWNIRPSGGSF